MKAIFAVLTVLVIAQSSFAAVSPAVNQDDPNNWSGDARTQAVAPNACRTRAGKDTRRLIQPNGERSGVETRTASGARSGSST